MKILITGANGYIGGYLQAELRSKNILFECSSRGDFDFTNINSIKSFFEGKGIDTVIHLAGVVDSNDLAGLFNINMLGIYNILQVCKENNVKRFVFASGNNVYGASSKEPFKESDVINTDPANKYGFSKYIGELIVKDFCEANNMQYVNVRIADVYGPDQKHGNLLKTITGNAKSGKALALYGEGIRTRDYTYVKDVAAGLVYITESDFSGTVNLGTGIGTSVKQMLDIVNEICGNALEIKNVAVEHEDESCVVLNVEKLISLGFRTTYSVKDGMNEIINGSNIMKKNPTILITGAGSTMGQSVMKALLMSKYGETVNIIVTNSEPLGASYFMSDRVKGKYLVPIAKDSNYIPKIIEICRKEKVDGIFSGTEHEIYALSNAAKQIKAETGAVVFLSRPEVIDIGTDKYKTYLTFKEHNIPFPETVLFDDYKKLVESKGYPIFMKPRIASASRNIFKINNEQELFEHKFTDGDQIVLQEYLDSNDEYTVESFCDKDGKVVGTIPMVRELGYGMSVSGEIVDNEEAVRVSEMICAVLKPEGAINVQLRMVNGKAVPFEINTRFSSTECIRAHYGFNSVEAAIDNYLYDFPIDLNNWRKGMFMRYWHECYFDRNDIPEE